MTSACSNTTILNRVKDKTAFQIWHDATTNSLNSVSVDLNLITLKSLETDIINTISCMQDQLRNIKGTPTTNYELQNEIVTLHAEVNNLSDDVKTAKERAQSITNLNQKVNQTESWFPIGRPLRQTSLFALIGLSIFFTMMVIGLGASYFGFELNLSWVPGPPYLRQGIWGEIWYLLYTWTNPLTLALLTSLFVTLGIVTWLRVKS